VRVQGDFSTTHQHAYLLPHSSQRPKSDLRRNHGPLLTTHRRCGKAGNLAVVSTVSRQAGGALVDIEALRRSCPCG
jgi:hypothetical protein